MIVSDTIRLFDEEDFSEDYPTSRVLEAVAYTFGIDPVRLRTIAEAERDGRLVVLPCKVGNTVYAREQKCNSPWEQKNCDDHEGGCEKCSHKHNVATALPFSHKMIASWGKHFFATREAAEAALAAKEDETHE